MLFRSLNIYSNELHLENCFVTIYSIVAGYHHNVRVASVKLIVAGGAELVSN